MSGLTSQQRKIAYLIGILVLLVPIIYFGLPSGGRSPDGRQTTGGGLARLRQLYDLGESNLGDVDPSSVTMNLVLLGLRGIAVNQLWIQMDDAKNHKDWPRMMEATESIVKLQPHYERVWDFNGWNLAWNVSVEWDAVPDRYYWVKRGGKFLIEGVNRNEKSTELRYDLGKIYQQKMGVADEADLFRKYFLNDPDTDEWKGGPDTEFNRGPDGKYGDGEGKDSFLVAHDWYTAAVENEARWQVPLLKGTLDRTAFHALPARCLFEYAAALQKAGKFGEVSREAWETALDEWINKFGREELHSPGPDGELIRYRLEATADEIRAMASSPLEEQKIRNTIDSFQKIVNYRYWRLRGLSESEQATSDAHQAFYEAGQLYKEQKLDEAFPLITKAMTGLESLLARYPDLRYEDNIVEECMLAVMMWSNIQRLEGEQPPQDYPLRSVYEENQSRIEEIRREFNRRFFTQVVE